MQIFRHTENSEILEENLHDGIAVYGDSFLADVFNVSNANIIHCRNSRGITDGEIGFSILMKLESLFQIERYIEEAYQISG